VKGVIRRVRPEWWSAIMEAAGVTFPPDNKHNVLGYGIGPRTTQGRRVGHNTLVLYVERKLREPPAPIEPVRFQFEGRTIDVQPDIVSVGGHFTPSSNGGPPAYSGLHAGAAILAYGSRSFKGAVGCVVGTSTAPTHLITAGHLFAQGEPQTPILAAISSNDTPEVIGHLVVNLLDRPQNGTTIDAAAVELNDAGRAMYRESDIDGPDLRAILPSTSGHGLQTIGFLPSHGGWTSYVYLLTTPKTVYAQPRARPQQYKVSNAYLAAHAITVPGDSGGILCAAQNTNYAAGLVVGELGTRSVFEPLERAFKTLAAYLNPSWLLYRR